MNPLRIALARIKKVQDRLNDCALLDVLDAILKAYPTTGHDLWLLLCVDCNFRVDEWYERMGSSNQVIFISHDAFN